MSQIEALLSYIKRIFLVSSKMVLFLAIINDITETSGLEPRFHVAAESELAVGPIGGCSRAWDFRDFEKASFAISTRSDRKMPALY